MIFLKKLSSRNLIISHFFSNFFYLYLQLYQLFDYSNNKIFIYLSLSIKNNSHRYFPPDQERELLTSFNNNIFRRNTRITNLSIQNTEHQVEAN